MFWIIFFVILDQIFHTEIPLKIKLINLKIALKTELTWSEQKNCETNKGQNYHNY